MQPKVGSAGEAGQGTAGTHGGSGSDRAGLRCLSALGATIVSRESV